MFPTALPTSREEVVHLGRVLDTLLEERPLAVKSLDASRVEAVMGSVDATSLSATVDDILSDLPAWEVSGCKVLVYFPRSRPSPSV
jgi:hypothetical protein